MYRHKINQTNIRIIIQLVLVCYPCMCYQGGSGCSSGGEEEELVWDEDCDESHLHGNGNGDHWYDQ